jgi:hypothetical protein
MNSIKYSLLFCILLFATRIIFPQQIEVPEISVEAQYLGDSKMVIARTQSIPPQNIYAIAGYNFQLKMTLRFPGNTPLQNSILGIAVILPDFTTEKLYFKPGNIVKKPNGEYEYSFPVKVKSRGYIKVFVCQIADFPSDEDVNFYTNTSNKCSLYLGP